MNIVLMGLLVSIAADMLFSAVQTEKWYVRQRNLGDLTATRVVALIDFAVLVWAVVTIA